MTHTRRTTAIVNALARAFPDARTELDHTDPFTLLVATVLSAQTTDQRVNAVTPELWRRWPTPAALAGAEVRQVEEIVRPLGMGPTRAGRIIGLAQALVADHDSRVPDDQDALEALPGVGRKTALVVRGVAFGQAALAVDTHVIRVSHRLGLSTARDAGKVEEQVIAQVGPTVDLTALSLRLILHGRRVCTARAPRCGDCVLEEFCPRIGVAA
jgi:endonuclease-3